MKCAAVVVLAACGSSSPKTPDAHVTDAAVDAAADASSDAAVLPSGAHSHYVVNHLEWPTNMAESLDDAFDLDNNGHRDNQIGAVIVALRAQGGIDGQSPSDEALARGVSITLADLQAPDLTSASAAGFTLFVGTNPTPMPCNGSADTTCGHHLNGSGSFDVAATPRDTPIVGPITGGVYDGGPGRLSMPIYISSGTPAFVTLLDARMEVTVAANGLVQGRIGGGIPSSDIDAKLYPAMQQGFTATVGRDCSALNNPPGCGCLQGSQGSALIAFLDANHDCAFTTAELQQSSILSALIHADVVVEGQTAISVGVAFTAVDATFTP